MDCSPPGSSLCGFPRQEYWHGLPSPSLADLTHPEMKPAYSASAGRFFTTEQTWLKYVRINDIKNKNECLSRVYNGPRALLDDFKYLINL